ncbi:hypothetical protein [Streptomyces sp. NPDC001492]
MDAMARFAPGCDIPEGEWDDIAAALANIACDEPGTRGYWPGGISDVWVLRRIAGGRSGSEVLELRLEFEDGDSCLQVAKVSGRAAAIKEWEAFQQVDKSARFALYVPIVAVSRGVLDQTPHSPYGHGRQVVVYQHVLDRDASGMTLCSLEELIAAGVRREGKLEQACTAVRTVTTALDRQLHRNPIAANRTLAPLNAGLGADIEAKVERVRPTDVDVALAAGAPKADQVAAGRRGGRAILENSTAPPGTSRTLSPGERITVRLDEITLSKHRVEGKVDNVAVVRVVAEGLAAEKDLSAEFDGERSLLVCADVMDIRALRWSRRLQHFLREFGEVRETEDELVCGQVVVAHPLRSLHRVLTRPKEHRELSAVHGDLNPRNVLLCGTNVYLIDFAASQESDLMLADYAWLEVCALREMKSAGISWPQLVCLQRQLAVLSKLATSVDLDCLDKIVTTWGDSSPSATARCLALLWEIRRTALSLAKGVCGQQAARHLFEHLTLAACRALKFPDDEQTGYKVAVCAATAGVAAEALNGPATALFCDWPEHHAEALCTAVLSCGQAQQPNVVDLLIAAQPSCTVTADASDEPIGRSLLQTILRGPLGTAIEQRRQQCPGVVPFIPLTGRILEAGKPLVQQGEGALTVAPRPALDLLLEAGRRVLLVGDCGAGKSVIAAELQARLLRGGLEMAENAAEDELPCCLPVELSALELSETLRQARNSPRHTEASSNEQPSPLAVLRRCAGIGHQCSDDMMEHLLEKGGIQLVVDDLHKVDVLEKPFVLAWIQHISEHYRQLRIVVCQRMWDYQPDDALRWPAVVLHKVRAQQAHDYIEDRLRQRFPQAWRERVRSLHRAIFDDQDAGSLRDLAGKPLFLRMMVEQYAEEETVLNNPGRLVELYLRRIVKVADESETERRLELLKQLARHMDEHGAAIRYDEALTVLRALRPANEILTLQTLLNSEAIVSDHSRSWVTFCNPIVHAYCVAAVLREGVANRTTATERILQFHWREAAQLLVADPQADHDMVRHVLTIALDANIVYGAWLLQAAPRGTFEDLREQLLDTTRATLASIDSGAPAWHQAAYALAKYGSAEALHILKTVAEQGDAAPAAAHALDGLVIMHQWFVPGATHALTQVLQHLLDQPATHLKLDLTVRALRSIATAGLHPLAGYVWTRITAQAPWPVICQAWQALEQLEVLPDAQLRRVYADASARRLSQIDEDLSRSAATATAQGLQKERMNLLHVLAEDGQLELLAAHRFRPGLADHGAWAELLHTAARRRQRTEPGDALAGLLCEADDTTDWLELLRGDDDTKAALAAHVMLHQEQFLDAQTLQSLGEDASPARLLALTGFVHGLNSDAVAVVDHIVRTHTPRLSRGYLEPLSALVGAVGKLGPEIRPRTALLVEEAARTFAGPSARYWPWAATWRDSVPDRTELALFLDTPGHQGSDLLKLISTTDVLLDAPPFEPVRLSVEHRERLAALQPGDPTSLDAHRFVMLAASAGLHECLAFIQEVARHITNATRTVSHSHPLHGETEVVLAAHATAAAGYLTRLAVQEAAGTARQALAENKKLAQMVTLSDGQHPSLQRARLVAMGFLGDWEEILDRLAPDDPVMHHAAGNIVLHWLPGPCTPTSDSHLTDVAEWISRKLREPGLPAATRAALTRIRDSIEARMGRYVR